MSEYDKIADRAIPCPAMEAICNMSVKTTAIDDAMGNRLQPLNGSPRRPPNGQLPDLLAKACNRPTDALTHAVGNIRGGIMPSASRLDVRHRQGAGVGMNVPFPDNESLGCLEGIPWLVACPAALDGGIMWHPTKYR